MALFQKVLSCLLGAKRDAHKHLEEKYAGFKRFVQHCNNLGEQKERQQSLKNIEHQFDEYA